MVATYRIEICPNNRAGCKDPVCKAKAEKIKKGELRFASWVEGCVSGAQIGTLRELCDMGDGEYDYNIIDGYDEMEDHPDVQEKIRRCVQQGHIDPEDFNGDPEKNKPGVKGIHLTAKQKEKRDREAAAAGGADSDEDTKQVKPKAKRGRKKAEDDEDEDEQPLPKKTKTAKGTKGGRKSAGSKVKDESEDESVVPSPVKGRKRASKVKAEPEDEDVDAVPVAKKRGRPAKVKKEESEAEEALKPKARKGRKSAVKAPTPDSDEVDAKAEEDVELEPAPKKKGRRASANVPEATDEKPKGRRRSSRTTS
ncbi:zf-PARP-domain-containing protein [Sarocladium strictum]